MGGNEVLTITRKDLLLTVNDNVIPAMGSSDVPVKFVNDTETYVGFLIEPRAGYYVNGCPKSTVCEYDTSSNIIKIPAEAFKNKGILVIAIALIDNADSNHIEVTKELALEVTPAPNGTVILPATDTWQTAVKNLVEQLYNQDYKSQFDQIEEDLSGLVEEAENQQSKAKEQQTQIDNAIDIMGDYEIVQDNPTQIRFKKGDGTYGDTVNLGDNLASKSMVNAGYDTYSGNSYSGSASDYGIEVAQIIGAYEQDGTPTPDAPIEPQFVEINNFNTNGGNLFDSSKLPSKTQGGATVTNNGDGSFTISGSGQLSKQNYSIIYLSHEETLSLIKAGKITFTVEKVTRPSFTVQFRGKGDKAYFQLALNQENSAYNTITKEMLNDSELVMVLIINGNSGDTIVGGTVKPILYQEGDGTWYPYNADSTPLSLTLRALQNGVKDTYENGVITRRVGYIEFDGSSDENWQLQTSNDSSLPNHYQFYIANEKMLKSSVLICDKALYKNTLPNLHDNAVVSTDIAINFFIPKTSLSSKSVDEFKIWLQSNHIGIWYQLATPTTEEIELPIIPSYFPYTNAWHDSEVEASDLTWNILAGQYGSGQTTIKKDEVVLTELDLNTERTVSPTTVKVQLKDTSGNVFYVETSPECVYLKGTDGSEITQKSLNDKIGQLINLVAFYSANPTTVLADLKKYITTIS